MLTDKIELNGFATVLIFVPFLLPSKPRKKNKLRVFLSEETSEALLIIKIQHDDRIHQLLIERGKIIIDILVNLFAILNLRGRIK